MPAAAVASLTPAIAGISGTSVGARGETAVDMRAPCWARSMVAGAVPAIDVFKVPSSGPRHGMAGHFGPAITMVITIGLEEVTAIFYFFAGAILESAGLAASGLVSFLAASAGLSMRSTLAASRSLATYSAWALRVT